MSSETPKDSASSSDHEGKHAHKPDNRDTPGSLGLENLEPHQIHGAAIMVNSGGDEPNYLMPHERKLSLSEQRQLLAGRRRVDDEPEEIEEDVEVRRGGRGRGPWSNAAHSGKEHASEASHKGVSHAGLAHAHESSHASHLGDSHKAHGPLLSDPDHPNKPLYDAVLHGVGKLDASKVPLSGAEQSNVAGALTANMTQMPGFNRGNPDPASISVAASESGDRIFAINSQNPGAPNAMHTSVALDQARGQSLSASSAQALVTPTPAAPELPNPTQDQAQPPERHAPRVIA
jgi:hypothetical protein